MPVNLRVLRKHYNFASSNKNSQKNFPGGDVTHDILHARPLRTLHTTRPARALKFEFLCNKSSLINYFTLKQ